MTEHDDNDLQALREQYRARSQETPGGAIDARIIAAAHAAVEPQAAPRRWQPAVAVAAVVVLSATLVLNLRPPSDERPAPRVAADAPTASPVAPAADAEMLREQDRADAITAGAKTTDTAVEDEALQFEEIVVTGTRLSDTEPETVVQASKAAAQARTTNNMALRRQVDARERIAAEASIDDPLAPILERWRAGEREVALEALANLVANDPDYDADRLELELPEDLFEAWQETP